MKTHMRNLTAIGGLIALALIALGGCATTDKTANNSRAQFLDEVWVGPELDGKAFTDIHTKVYFAPVTVEQLKEQSWWASQNARTKNNLDADAKKLATYTTNALMKSVANYPTRRMQVVNQPGPDTFIIECAITELVPTKAFWNAAASAAGFVVPGAGLLSTAGKGAVAFEGRVKDGQTGAVLATFRDRETDKTALVNTASYTWYHGSEANIDDLSQKTAAALNTPAGTIVKRSAPIKLTAF